LERVLTGFAGGAVSGVLAGLLLSRFVSWGKDFRDARLRAARIPLPSDRVFPRFHWPFAAVGACLGAILALVLDISPVWGALAVFAVPALYLPFLVLSALFTWLGPSLPARLFDPGTLVGKDIAEAERVLLKDGWPYEVIEEEPDQRFIARPHRRRGISTVLLSVRDGRVTRAELDPLRF
jgi:hypothetical protein